MNIEKLLYQNIVWRGLFYLLTFILNITIARHFQAEVTGMLYYLINIFAFISLITSVSLESGLIYFASSKKIDYSKLLNFSLVWIGFIALILVALFVIISYFLAISVTDTQFVYALLFVCGNLLLTFFNGLFYADNNFKVPNITGIVINSFLIILIFFVNENHWLTNEKYIFIYFEAYFIQGVILVVIFMIGLKREYVFRLPAIPEIKSIFKYCLLAFASNLVTFLYYRIDYFFVHHYCSAEALGNYIQVSKLAQMFFVLPGILAAVVFPITAGGQKQEMKNILKIISRSVLFFYTGICFLLVISGQWLFPFVFGETFSNMYVPFLLLIPGILGLSTLYTLTAYYAGKNRIIINLKGALLTLLIIVAGDIIFIPRYGINASAMVSSIGYIAYHMYVLSIFKKEDNSPVIDFFKFKFSDISTIKRFFLKNR